MIRHQDIRVNGAAIATAGIGEALSKDEIILVPREDRTAIVPALDYVQRLFRHEKSWSTWHSNLPRANEQSRDYYVGMVSRPSRPGSDPTLTPV
jgi:hypothetical protein